MGSQHYLAFTAVKGEEDEKFANKFHTMVNGSSMEDVIKNIRNPSENQYETEHYREQFIESGDGIVTVIFDRTLSVEGYSPDKKWYLAFTGEKYIRTSLVYGTEKEAENYVMDIGNQANQVNASKKFTNIYPLEYVGVLKLQEADKIFERVTKQEKKVEIVKKHVDGFIKR